MYIIRIRCMNTHNKYNQHIKYKHNKTIFSTITLSSQSEYEYYDSTDVPVSGTAGCQRRQKFLRSYERSGLVVIIAEIIICYEWFKLRN